MTFDQQLTDHLADPDISAVVFESVLEPSQGAFAAISPPTYAASTGRDSAFATSENSPIPVPSSDGWHHDIARTGPENSEPGSPRRGTRVVINSIPANSGAAEEALYSSQDRLRLSLPAIVIDGNTVPKDVRTAALTRALGGKREATELERQQLDEALNRLVSSWLLAHRLSDSWVQYAADPQVGPAQLWSDASNPLRGALLNISHASGDVTYAHGPNAALYGGWLSSGSAFRHAIPRAYACETVGYGATPVDRGATKLDPTGGASVKARKVKVADHTLSVGATGSRPSELGFGQVPVHPRTTAFSCEVILAQGSISLRALDRFQYPDDSDGVKAAAARRVYTLLGMLGHALATRETFLRSGCDLVCVDERWGWRRHGQRTPVAMEIPTIDTLAEALRSAIDAAAQAGLEFAPVHTLTFSEAQVDLIADRIVTESAVEAKAAGSGSDAG